MIPGRSPVPRRSERSKKTCSALLQVVEEKQRQVLLVWVIGRDNQGVLRTVIQSPTGIQIPKGLELKFGNGPTRALPIRPVRRKILRGFDSHG